MGKADQMKSATYCFGYEQTLAELIQRAKMEFPDVPLEKIEVYPCHKGYCIQHYPDKKECPK